VAKSKAALTASRTAANAIYVAPLLQASMDTQSGTIHCQEGDYNTAYSYFLEAFEQLDQLSLKQEATPCLKYMVLCKILHALNKALKENQKTNLDLTSLVTAKQALQYAGRDLEALQKIAQAASKRSLKDLEAVLTDYSQELNSDLLIQHHLHILQEQLLESNLLRELEPYSCVELSHIAHLMELPLPQVERKLSQMILDGKFHGILNQGEGQLMVYEQSTKDQAMETGLGVIANMDAVVSTLFERSKALRTMMM
jgi:26S proteasome regulatory subunit N6